MKKGDVCEVVGTPLGEHHFCYDGARCEILTHGDDTSLVMFPNGHCITISNQNLRLISEFKRGDRVAYGLFKDCLNEHGTYYDYDNEAPMYKHLVRNKAGNVESWIYCKKAEPEIKKDTKVLVSRDERQWFKHYATGETDAAGRIRCYQAGADSWSNFRQPLWYKYWKIADENDYPHNNPPDHIIERNNAIRKLLYG